MRPWLMQLLCLSGGLQDTWPADVYFGSSWATGVWIGGHTHYDKHLQEGVNQTADSNEGPGEHYFGVRNLNLNPHILNTCARTTTHKHTHARARSRLSPPHDNHSNACIAMNNTTGQATRLTF